MENQTFNLLTATGTITNKSENQDAHIELENSIIVADGLGSLSFAGVASQIVVQSINAELLNNFEKSERNGFKQIFENAKRKLINQAAETGNDANHYGTTVIVALDNQEELEIAYAGNGAIWHIKGNFNEFPSTYIFPWNAVNLLNPHSIPQGGKEALYRLVSANSSFQEAEPSIINLRKDNFFGDILMICTDGIFSNDQLNMGSNSAGKWIKLEETMNMFFQKLKIYFEEVTEPNRENLNEFVTNYLEAIKPIIDDDASIGILITPQVLQYQNNKRVENNNNLSNDVVIENNPAQ
ncbi:protein phosphatase 2C domain-containing protein [Sphingobacterium daejeonense]|uniref:protein phosphatase 2C domain-containing protein n=1 Tax=Sphingobacterium daejeonense TaxID=371142 RepID=UPI0010C5404F|nr:protein phosphatase 2C domain-containing protein [Sphingobacterium daejeonense]VTP92178.1 Uncharacterised protein [Sphingobacterium daejeonense]